MRTNRAPRRAAGEAGFTLVELIVIVFILGVVGAIALATFNSGSNALGRVDDDVRGQQDLKIVTERLTRDVRAGRGVHKESDPSELSIWIDYDADYIKDTATEIVVWDVVANTSDTAHFDVRRTVGGSTQVVGRAVIDALAFKYYKGTTGALTEIDSDPDDNPLTTTDAVEDAAVVEVSMDYDAIVGAYLQEKTNTYQIRLRNSE